MERKNTHHLSQAIPPPEKSPSEEHAHHQPTAPEDGLERKRYSVGERPVIEQIDGDKHEHLDRPDPQRNCERFESWDKVEREARCLRWAREEARERLGGDEGQLEERER